MKKTKTKYRHLKQGEIIIEGDEVEMSAGIKDPIKWVQAITTIGQAAPDPAFIGHRQYRRLISKPVD